MEKHIMPECYIDTMLVKSLLLPKQKLNHQYGCHKVSKELELGALKDKFGVGVIDEDKESERPRYLMKEFGKAILIELDEKEIGIKLFKHPIKHPIKHHYFVQICPEIEDWILKICEEESIDLENDFNLPSNKKELSSITKRQKTEFDERFMGLFRRFKETENQKVQKLMEWLRILKEKNYNADINELKNV